MIVHKKSLIRLVLCFLLFGSLYAQKRAFIYVKAHDQDTKVEVQQLLHKILKEKYIVSSSKKMYSLLKKYSFFKKNKGQSLRDTFPEKNVAFVMLIQVKKENSTYDIYARAIFSAMENIYQQKNDNKQTILSNLEQNIRSKILREVPFTSWLCIAITCVLILVVFGYSLFILISKARVNITSCFVQLILFQLLFLEIYYLLGNHHFDYQEGSPNWYQWIFFMIFHVFRAIDIIDFLEEFDIGIYFLKHNTILCGSFIVFMRLMIDVFVIAIVVKFFNARTKNIRQTLDSFKRRWKQKILYISAFASVIFVSGYIACIIFEKWLLLDALLLWPIDNILRVIDIGDCLQTFNWSLHSVWGSYLHSAMDIAFRFAVGIYIAKWIDKLSTVYFRGAGLTVDEILDNLENKNLRVAKIMLTKLANLGPEVKSKAIPRFIKLTTKYQIDFKVNKQSRKEYIFFGKDLSSIEQENLNYILCCALKNIDKNGLELCKHFESTDINVRSSASKLLSSLGKDAIAQIMFFLGSRNESIRMEASECLNRMTDPPGKWTHTREYLNELPIIIRLLHSYDIEVQKMALQILKSSKITSSIAGSAVPVVRKMLKDTTDKEIKSLCHDVIDVYKGICFDDNGNYICY